MITALVSLGTFSLGMYVGYHYGYAALWNKLAQTPRNSLRDLL